LECTAEGGERLLVLAGGAECAAELKGVIEVVRSEAVGFSERGDGGGRIVLGEEDRAEMKVCGGEGWVERNGLLEVCGGFRIVLALCLECAEGVL
jgi:hypothetical protein